MDLAVGWNSVCVCVRVRVACACACACACVCVESENNGRTSGVVVLLVGSVSTGNEFLSHLICTTLATERQIHRRIARLLWLLIGLSR